MSDCRWSSKCQAQTREPSPEPTTGQRDCGHPASDRGSPPASSSSPGTSSLPVVFAVPVCPHVGREQVYGSKQNPGSPSQKTERLDRKPLALPGSCRHSTGGWGKVWRRKKRAGQVLVQTPDPLTTLCDPKQE